MSELIYTIRAVSMLCMVPCALIAAIIYTSLQVDTQSFKQVAKDTAGNILTRSLRRIMYFCGAMARTCFVLFIAAEIIPSVLEALL